MKIYCCGCERDVEARLTSGKEIYPHRRDLYDLPFWKCDDCGGKVGCHHKTKDRTRPLGNIPTKEITEARQHIHRLLDPMWQRGGWPRGKIYARLTHVIGREYHTAEIRSVDEARVVYAALQQLQREGQRT